MSAPAITSFQFAYKNDQYVVSVSFEWWGKAVFNHGLPSFEVPVSMVPLSLSAKGVPTIAYSIEEYMGGQQYIFGAQLNGSYKLNDAFSVALGLLRLNMVSNGYKGHLKNIQINPVHPTLNPTGDII